ncbi:MAG: SPASM domain-containing protein [Lachnospiraceae bacterium]|nr:SPASM domain-containing protein [Lachnospiraceae bacterium]
MAEHRKYRLKSCVWEITLACCFSCAYCGSKAGKAREDELTLEECLSVAGQLADLGCQRVSLLGGEVFMRGDWADIVNALTERKIGIDSIGNVRGCEAMYDDYFIEGNVRTSTLKEIWESPDSFRYNRGFKTELLTGKCRKCTYGRVCAGGCRSYNYFAHGKLYESPFCVRNTV